MKWRGCWYLGECAVYMRGLQTRYQVSTSGFVQGFGIKWYLLLGAGKPQGVQSESRVAFNSSQSEKV